MIQLTTKNPSLPTLTHLRTKQADVDGQPTFNEKVDRADTLWNGKNGAAAGRIAFTDIKSCLVSMSASAELCNYCETNEGTDIEHIHPKKLYPEYTFDWNNYLLACGTCNTHEKSDAFAIFDPAGTNTVYEIPRTRGVYVQPVNNDRAFINQRIEDPMRFFYLDVKGRTFHFGVHPSLAVQRDIEKAKYTRKVLRLNERPELVEARRTAAQHYLDRLAKYIKVRDAVDFEQLDDATSDDDGVDDQKPFDDERNRIMESIKKDIKTYRNPVVWRELKRQRDNLNKTKGLFENAPEAINW